VVIMRLTEGKAEPQPDKQKNELSVAGVSK
jgi:hypothetical protein